MNPVFTYFLYAGAILHLVWAGLHLFIPRVLNWKKSLDELDSMNRATYQVMNLCLVFFMVVLAYVSFVYAPELLSTGLGKKLLAIITAFWLFRLSLQFRFYQITHPASLLLNLLFLLTALAYAYPLLKAH